MPPRWESSGRGKNVRTNWGSFASLLCLVLVVLAFEAPISVLSKKKSKGLSFRPVVDLGIGAASQHSCVVLSNGLGIKCFGPNMYGQLGQLHARTIGDDGPYEFGDCLRTSALGPDAQPKQVVMGSTFTCALLGANGDVRCFGYCANGQCGTDQAEVYIGDSPSRPVTGEPPIRFESPVIQLSAGELHVCALTQNKRVYCWGAGGNGQLGNGEVVEIVTKDSSVPIDFGFNRTARQVSAGYSHTCAILDSKSHPGTTDLVCFGSCLFGKCGTGQVHDQIEMGERLPPIELGKDVSGQRRFALQVAAGAAHTCVLLNTYDVACFGLGRLLGNGGKGNIGDDPFEMESIPLVNLNRRKASMITVGQQHSCAVLTETNKAVCWGEGEGGVLGYNSEDQVLAPGDKVVRLQFRVKQIQAYASHTCALSMNGQVSCFGNKKQGRVGLLSLSSTTRSCVGCKKGQMGTLPTLNFGCINLSKSGTCPALQETNGQCEVCRKKWSQRLCFTYAGKCRWNRQKKICQRLPY